MCADDGTAPGVPKAEVLEGLTALADKSLLVFDAQAGDTDGRYRLLEMVRQYAAERLQESGEATAVKTRHCKYFLALAQETEPQLKGAGQAEWLARLETEHGNLRAALAWCGSDRHGADAGLRLAGSLWRFWEMRGYYGEGRRYLVEALGREGAGGPTRERAKALNGAGVLATYQGDYAAARALHEESLAISRRLADKQGIAWSLNDLGKVAGWQGDYDTARTLYGQSLALFREMGYTQGIGWTLHQLGSVVAEQGDYAAARTLYEESLTISRGLADEQGVAWSLNDLGKVALDQGDSQAARALYAQSLKMQQELKDRRGAAASLEGLAAVMLTEAARYTAVSLWGTAHALRESIGTPMPPNRRKKYVPQRDQARLVLGEDAFAAAWEEGRARPWEQARDRAPVEAEKDHEDFVKPHVAAASQQT